MKGLTGDHEGLTITLRHPAATFPLLVRNPVQVSTFTRGVWHRLSNLSFSTPPTLVLLTEYNVKTRP